MLPRSLLVSNKIAAPPRWTRLRWPAVLTVQPAASHAEKIVYSSATNSVKIYLYVSRGCHSSSILSSLPSSAMAFSRRSY
jgi:hypothetical protein